MGAATSYSPAMADEERSLGRRAANIAAGAFVTLLGIAMLVLPGPGILTMIVGLNLLGREIPAAQRLVARLRRRAGVADEEATPDAPPSPPAESPPR